MEDNRQNGGFKWRWIAVVVTVLFVVASLFVVGAMAYKLGHEHGYNQLEKEIVYAIAINNSKRVGNFLVAKLENGGTIIALNELPFSAEKGEQLHK